MFKVKDKCHSWCDKSYFKLYHPYTQYVPLGDIPIDRVICCKGEKTFLVISVKLCKYFALMVFSLDPDKVFTGLRHLKDFLSSYLQSSTSVRMLQLSRILTGVKLQWTGLDPTSHTLRVDVHWLHIISGQIFSRSWLDLTNSPYLSWNDARIFKLSIYTSVKLEVLKFY